MFWLTMSFATLVLYLVGSGTSAFRVSKQYSISSSNKRASRSRRTKTGYPRNCSDYSGGRRHSKPPLLGRRGGNESGLCRASVAFAVVGGLSAGVGATATLQPSAIPRPPWAAAISNCSGSSPSSKFSRPGNLPRRRSRPFPNNGFLFL